MSDQYQALEECLHYMENAYHLHLCIKDYVGFIPIDKALSNVLMPFLGHTNPYCMHIKKDRKRYHHCLSMMKKIAAKCLQEGQPFRGVCCAGVGEYVVPILWEGQLLGAITAGFLAVDEAEVSSRIHRAMDGDDAKAIETAQLLYHQHILPTAAPEQVILPMLRFVASYLSMTYRMSRESVGGAHLVKPRASGADEIFRQALAFIHQEYQNRITVALLTEVCHCSESYLNHLLKRRLGVSLNTYVNKLRIEHAKELLLDTDQTMLSISTQVGFQDANYFSRVFMQLMDIAPSEFRRRYR